jgi:hypothetical protein
MLHDWGVIAAAFGYIGLLFVVASYGERLTQVQRGRLGTFIYPLSLAITARPGRSSARSASRHAPASNFSRSMSAPF